MGGFLLTKGVLRMSYEYHSKALVIPTLTITDPFGRSQVIVVGSYASGFWEISKAESVKRVKPVSLKAPESLTGFGGHSEEDMNYGSYSAVVKSGGYTYSYTDLNAQGAFAVGRNVVADDPDWESKLRLAIKDQNVNLAQSMAEYHQLQSMFVKNATTVYRFMRWLKRGKGNNPFSGKARLRKPTPLEIPNRYLEFQFGIKPLISDLEGSIEEFEKAAQRPHYRQFSISAKARAKKERHGILSLDGRKLEAEDEDQVVIKVKAIVLGESFSAQRLGFTNPAALAWELLPYSFVIDYFVGVGNWLQGFDALIGIQQCYGTVTRKSKYISTSNLGGRYTQKTYGRSVFLSLPGSRAYPKWNPSLGYTRVANILALFAQLASAKSTTFK